MRERPFDSCTTSVVLPPLLTGIPSSRRLQRFEALLRREMEAAPGVRGPGAEGPGGTGPAVLAAEADQGIRLALPSDILAPHG